MANSWNLKRSSQRFVEALEYGRLLARSSLWELHQHPSGEGLLVYMEPTVNALVRSEPYQEVTSIEGGLALVSSTDPQFEAITAAGTQYWLLHLPGNCEPLREEESRAYCEIFNLLRLNDEVPDQLARLARVAAHGLANRAQLPAELTSNAEHLAWAVAALRPWVHEHVVDAQFLVDPRSPVFLRQNDQVVWLPTVLSDPFFIPF